MNDSTMIAVVIDKSGSMASVRDQTIASFNKFLSAQREAKGAGKATLTLTMFDYTAQVVYSDQPIEHVAPLSHGTYRPNGGTALLDAVGATIDRMGGILAHTPEATRPSKVLVAIITDGEENSSKEYTLEAVQTRIRHQEEKYSWKFLYLGAGLGSREQGIAMGVMPQAAATYDSHRIGETYAVVSNAVLRYRNSTGGASGQSVANFTETEVRSLVENP